MMGKKRFSWVGALAIPCILVFVALVSCDIGNWDVTRSAESQRNFDAFERINFLTGEILTREGVGTGQYVPGRFAMQDESGAYLQHPILGGRVQIGVGAYPLAFGVSTQWDSVGITGGGQQSRRFTDGRSWRRSLPGEPPANQQQVGANPAIDTDSNSLWDPDEWGSPRVGPIDLPETSVHRGNPYFLSPSGHYRIPPTVPPGFIEVAAVSNNRGGKIAGSEDGIAFLFREVPLSRNFVMEADFLIVQYGNILADGAPRQPGSNGQEGFGIMVRDFVPQIPHDTRSGTTMANFEINHRWRLAPDEGTGNLVAGMHGDQQNFWAGGPLHGSDSNMFLAGGTKRGMNVKERTGITRGIFEHDGTGNPRVAGIQNPINANFHWWPRPWPDYSWFTENVNGEDIATFAARPTFPRWGSTVRVRLARTNEGFEYTIQNLDDYFDNIDIETGRLLSPPRMRKPAVSSAVHGIVRDWEILNMVNDSHFYVGLFAARDAVVWVSNITYMEVDADLMRAAQPVRPDLFDPTLEVLSPAIWSGVNTLHFASNTAGRIEVLQNGRRIPDRLITNEWIDARENGTGVPMTLFTVPIHEPTDGDNVFSVLFQPGALPREHAERNMMHSSNAPIRRTFTITRRSFHSGEYGRDHNGQASIIFAAPTAGGWSESGVYGSPLGDGTRGSPLDLQTAIHHLLPGQHIVMLNGRYVFDRQLVIPRFNDGTQDAMKVLRAETVNRVWLDWNKNEEIGPMRMPGRSPIGADAFRVFGSFWHFDGFHVRGGPDKVKGLTVSGSNNLFTRLSIYNHGDTGFQISFRDAEPTRFWPSDNRVMWVESFHNLDAAQTDADGFGAKLTVGERNMFYSSIAHHNNDDGWDLFSKRESGPIGVTLVDRSIAYRQGWMINQHRTAAGGIGFKMGGENIGIFHRIEHSLAFGNTTPIGSNSNPNLLVRNSTAIVGERVISVVDDNGGVSYGIDGAGLPGLIAITGPAPVGGMAFNSVGVLTRAGFLGMLTNQANPNIPINLFEDAPDRQPQGSNVPYLVGGSIDNRAGDAATDWRAFMVRRPASFWGEGYALGTQGRLVNTTVGQPGSAAVTMPETYQGNGPGTGWDQFAVFFPRDDYFAYPILELPDGRILYEGPQGMGAYRLHRGERKTVTDIIPWAVRDPSRPWNGTN